MVACMQRTRAVPVCVCLGGGGGRYDPGGLVVVVVGWGGKADVG